MLEFIFLDSHAVNYWFTTATAHPLATMLSAIMVVQ